MRRKIYITLVLCISIVANAQTKDNLFEEDTVFIWNNPKNSQPHFINAGVQTIGLNVFVNLFDRFVLNEDFAKINFKTIEHNIDYGFVWDNDKFATNLFFHPYHGNLYFNSARSNGLSFIQSMPYAFCGSLMWETCGEVEPPAINDLIATTIGGICLGEITFRLSDLLLDDNSYGWERFVREFFATAISPMKGLNRLLTGDMFKHRNICYGYYNDNIVPATFSVSLGDRYLCDHSFFTKGEHNPFVDLGVEYGDVYYGESQTPYNYFTLDVSFGLSANQPLISHVSLLGRLWGLNLQTGTDMKLQFGLFQNFNYYNSESFIDGSDDRPYRISEAASVGTGVIYEFPKANNIATLKQRLFFNAILLGGSASDYYRYIDRDYNMGSGFSARMNTYIEFVHSGEFILNVEYYRIFTWKGYEKTDYARVNPLYLNSQGDKSIASLFIVNPKIELFLSKSLDLELSAYYFIRNTEYKYFSDVTSKTFELRLGLNYHL